MMGANRALLVQVFGRKFSKLNGQEMSKNSDVRIIFIGKFVLATLVNLIVMRLI